jgi:glucan phosphorylase
MPQPQHACGKEAEWGGVGATLEYVTGWMARQEIRDEKVVEALQQIAEHGGTIKEMKEHEAKQDKSINTLFERDRNAIKNKPLVVRMWEHKVVGWALLGLILFGSVCDIVFHTAFVREAWVFFH